MTLSFRDRSLEEKSAILPSKSTRWSKEPCTASALPSGARGGQSVHLLNGILVKVSVFRYIVDNNLQERVAADDALVDVLFAVPPEQILQNFELAEIEWLWQTRRANDTAVVVVPNFSACKHADDPLVYHWYLVQSCLVMVDV